MRYAMINVASKVVYYVLQRGGGEGVKLWSKWYYLINEQPHNMNALNSPPSRRGIRHFDVLDPCRNLMLTPPPTLVTLVRAR